MATQTPLRPTLWRTCRILANRSRLRALALLLRHSPLTVTEVARQLDMTLSFASQSLRALEARGMLKVKRRGRSVEYAPVPEPKGFARDLLPALQVELTGDDHSVRTVFRILTAFTHPKRILLYQAIPSAGIRFEDLARRLPFDRQSLRRHLRKLLTRHLLIQTSDGFIRPAFPVGALPLALARAVAADVPAPGARDAV